MDKKRRAADLMKVCKFIKASETEREIMINKRKEALEEVAKLNELIEDHKKYEKNTLGLFDKSLIFSARELVEATAMANSMDVNKLRIECHSLDEAFVYPERFNELKTSHFRNYVKVTVKEEWGNMPKSETFEYEIHRGLLGSKSISECFDIKSYKMRSGILGCYLSLKPECEKDLQVVINPNQVKDLSADFINALIAVSMNGTQLKVKRAPSVE